jgi:hypothetical protein
MFAVSARGRGLSFKLHAPRRICLLGAVNIPSPKHEVLHFRKNESLIGGIDLGKKVALGDGW